MRNIEVDTLRGMACLLLVLAHVIGLHPSTGLRLPDAHPLSQMVDALAYLRMPLFSFLSAYVYAWRPYRGGFGAFAAGKARRLLVPMLIVGTAFAVLQANTPGANDGVKVWTTLHLVPVSHYWFLESLFIIFVLLAGLERFGLLSTQRRFAGVMAAAVVVHLALPGPVYFGWHGATYLLPYFLLGVWCNRFGTQIPTSTALAGALLALAVGAVIAASGEAGRRSVAALLIGGGACVTLLRLRLRVELLARIGVHSFAIYLFHSVFTAAARIGFERIGGVPLLTVLVLVGLAAGILGPIVVEWALRRLPLGHLALGESRRANTKGVLHGNAA